MRIGFVTGIFVSAGLLTGCTTGTDGAEAYWSIKYRKQREKILADQEMRKRDLAKRQVVFTKPAPDTPCLLNYTGKAVRPLLTDANWKKAGVDSKVIKSLIPAKVLKMVASAGTWVLLDSTSLRAVFPNRKIVRFDTSPSPHLTGVALHRTVMVQDGAPKMLNFDEGLGSPIISEKEVSLCIGKSGFKPANADDARKMVFAFAEVCGYALVRKPPHLRMKPEIKSVYEVDWTMQWIQLEELDGWRVSCVFRTGPFNWHCDRYVMEIRRDGRFAIKSREGVFDAFGFY